MPAINLELKPLSEEETTRHKKRPLKLEAFNLGRDQLGLWRDEKGDLNGTYT